MAKSDLSRTYFKRKGQPHILPQGAIFSVTFRLHDAIPKQMIQRVKKRRTVVLREIELDSIPNKQGRKEQIEQKYYHFLEGLMHQKSQQEHLLRNGTAAHLVIARLEEYAKHYYHLLAYCVMSNHVHLLLDFSLQCPPDWDGISSIEGYINLPEVIRKIKGGSAYDINKALCRKGKVWAKGNYNRLIRNYTHLENEFWYILHNSQKAGVVACWRDHPFTYGDFSGVGLVA